MPSRRRPRPIALPLVLLCAASFVAGCGQRSEPRARNVVLICIDTVRFDVFDALERVGDDRLARWSPRALYFENALSTAPWTVPAVASVLTGRTPNHHGAGAFGSEVAHLGETVPRPLARDVPTLAERLSPLGFERVAIVAHAWFKTRFGLDRGMDGVALVESTPRIVEVATGWLEKRGREGRSAPFLLYLHLMDAHGHIGWKPDEKRRRAAALTPAQRVRALAIARDGFCQTHDSSRCRTFLAYVQSVVAQRDAIARVLDTLDEEELLEQTLVVLYADHGEEFHDHLVEGRARGGDPRDIYGFGHGHAMYQELLHVPLVAWHPQLAGGRIATPVSLADVTPSLLEWLGVDAAGDAGREPFDGRSFWPASQDAAAATDRPRFASSIAYGPEQVSVVQGRWKRTLHLASGERALHDLDADPRERSPAEGGPTEAELDRLVDDYLGATRASSAEAPALSAEELQALQALGYLDEADAQAETGREAADDQVP